MTSETDELDFEDIHDHLQSFGEIHGLNHLSGLVVLLTGIMTELTEAHQEAGIRLIRADLLRHAEEISDEDYLTIYKDVADDLIKGFYADEPVKPNLRLI